MSMSIQARKSLTLIELIVVLTILAAVAGIVLPSIADYSRQSHGATGAFGIANIDHALRRHEANQQPLGSDFDSLINSSGAPIWA